ncbi:MAG: DMT family transporter, partial [Lachnospiraceae bacterium]|nr:DMT family transporter [Lachnospiraceae bacterium]
QQVGVSLTTAGKAGFITAIYIILVPILSIFLGHRIPKIIWFCAFLSLTGFYFLCIKEGFSVNPGDIYCLICAFCFSVQIMTIDHFTKKDWKVDPVMISMVQFFVVGLISTFLMLLFETPSFPAILRAGGSILYAGALSSGVAYTLQILGQRDSSPETAPLIMSLESVFAAIFGCLLLGEVMTAKEVFGCVLVFISVILSQLPWERYVKENRPQ